MYLNWVFKEDLYIKLTEKFQNINVETNWNVIKDFIFKTAEDTIEYSKINQSNRLHNVEQMSKEQNQVRIKISNFNNPDKAKNYNKSNYA